MFYRKTDIETLCDTLITLVEKHDKALMKFGPQSVTPHIKAIDILMKKIDDELKKPAPERAFTVVKKEVTKVTEPVKRTFTNGKKKLKPAITVMHGAADDLKHVEHRVIEKVEGKSEAKTSPNALETTITPKDDPKPVDDVILEVKKTVNETFPPIAPKYVAPDNPPEVHPDGTPKQVTAPLPAGVVTPDNIDAMVNQLVD